jgi:cytochrome b6-f complex iron-sulfur subunit
VYALTTPQIIDLWLSQPLGTGIATGNSGNDWMNDETTQTAAQSRREFCVAACHAASALAIGSVLQSCGGGGGNPAGPSGGGTPAPALTVINVTPAGGAATLTVDGASPLAAVGSAAMVRTGSSGDLLVARTAQDTFSALTATCTHEACSINGFRSPNFVCPCHGSQFSTSGQVINGPATRALRTYPTQFSGNTLTITL